MRCYGDSTTDRPNASLLSAEKNEKIQSQKVDTQTDNNP